MYLSLNRRYYERVYSILTGSSGPVKSSQLLQAYATISAMKQCKRKAPEAYSFIKNKFGDYSRGLLLNLQQPFAPDFENTFYPYASISLRDFLFHVVPDIVYDVSGLINDHTQFYEEISYNDVIFVHHILQVKLTGHKYFADLHTGKIDPNFRDGELNEKLYSIYKKIEQKYPLSKTLFLKLYLTVNYYKLNPNEDSPRLINTSEKTVADFLSIVFDQLQLTHGQAYKMIADYFVRDKQPRWIVNGEDVSRYSNCNEANARIKLVAKAITHSIKLSPLEAICAISKTPQSRKDRLSRQGYYLSEEIAFENSFIYSLFFSNLVLNGEDRILLLFPSPYFVRKIIRDSRFRNYQITIVLDDPNVVDSLIWQVNDYGFNTSICRLTTFISYNDWKVRAKTEQLSKILFFGTHMSSEKFTSVCNDIQHLVENFAVLYVLEPWKKDLQSSLVKFSGSKIKLDSQAFIHSKNKDDKKENRNLFSRYFIIPNSQASFGSSTQVSVFPFSLTEFLGHAVIGPASLNPFLSNEEDLLKIISNDDCGAFDETIQLISQKGNNDLCSSTRDSNLSKDPSDGYMNLIKSVLDLSDSKIWEEAVSEWEISDFAEDEERLSACICGKHGLRYLFTIHNKVTGEFLSPIGSTCINKFNRDDLSEDIVIKEEILKVSHFVKQDVSFGVFSKFFSKKLLRALFDEGVFKPSAYNGFNGFADYEFMLKLFLQRNKSKVKPEELKRFKRIMDNSIIPYLGSFHH